MSSNITLERYPALTSLGVEIKQSCIGCNNLERLERHAGIIAVGGTSAEYIEASELSLNCNKGVIQPASTVIGDKTNCTSASR